MSDRTMEVEVLRTNGTMERKRISRENYLQEIRELIGAELLDKINLRDGRVMLLDDGGYEYEVVELAPNHLEHRVTRARLPVNEHATVLYHAICRPGVTHQIVGDVVLVHEASL